MSRKYRHQGYRDEEFREDREPRKAPPRKPLTPEERAQRRGLRHALDRDAREVLRCPTCGRTAQNLGAVTPASACPHCNAALRCCRACRHFDSAARWQCRAEIAEPVTDKNRANHCPRYEPRLVLDATGRRSENATARRAGDPKAAFESLFKR